ncbi:MAG: hypothetical protein AAF447_10090 [Myxococcota bacterium]
MDALKDRETSLRESLELNAQLLDALESKLVGLEQVTEAQRARVAQLAAGLLAVRSAETRAPEQDGSSAILAE